jgi:hypothetical protein
MTKEEIIEMVKLAGWSGIYTQWAEPTGEADWSPYKVSLTVPVTMEQIKAFAKLVAEHEREACAVIAETPISGEQDDITMEAKDRVAKAIRARGQE